LSSAAGGVARAVEQVQQCRKLLQDKLKKHLFISAKTAVLRNTKKVNLLKCKALLVEVRNAKVHTWSNKCSERSLGQYRLRFQGIGLHLIPKLMLTGLLNSVSRAIYITKTQTPISSTDNLQLIV
jgi:hypothetical protein